MTYAKLSLGDIALVIGCLLSPALAMSQTITPFSADSAAIQSEVNLRTKPNAVQLQAFEYVIPQLIVGGEWTSTIRFVNRGTKNFPQTNVFLVDDSGNPLPSTFQTSNGNTLTATAFSITLNAGGMAEATFAGTSETKFGHAFVGCSATGCNTSGLYGEVTLRNRNATRPDFESVFPFERPYSLQYMLFDGRNGNTTVLYLVNGNTSSSQVLIDVVDVSNRILRTVSLSFAPLSTQILTLHVLSQETIGIQGTLVIRGSNLSQTAFITATGLKINPSNSFTPIRAFVPAP